MIMSTVWLVITTKVTFNCFWIPCGEKLKNLLINTDFSSRACKKMIMLSNHYYHNLWSLSLTAIFLYGPNQKFINFCGQFKVHSMTVYLSYIIRKIFNNYWTRLSKILWFVCGEQINYLPKPKAETNNNWSARQWQITIFCDNWVHYCFIIWSPSIIGILLQI